MDEKEKMTERLRKAWGQLAKAKVLTKELGSEVKALFLPEASVEEKQKAYMEHLNEYEDLIFYSWAFPELCEEAAKFWDDVLKSPKTLYTGNSIIRILVGRRPNQQLLKVLQNHRGRFFDDTMLGYVIKTIVMRYIAEPGMFNVETKSCESWTETETNILKNIVQLF